MASFHADYELLLAQVEQGNGRKSMMPKAAEAALHLSIRVLTDRQAEQRNAC